MMHHMTCHMTQYDGEVRRCLPRADDSAARKKTLWKTLFEGFDQIDGKPTQAEKEVTPAHQKIINTHIPTYT